MDCLFCQIVKGEVPSHKVWEDEKHLAFLSIFPNTPGFTVVITKNHFPSDLFSLPNEVFVGLVLAARDTARRLNQKLPDVRRTGLIIEGMAVDHAHIKLFPMHGTAENDFTVPAERPNKFFRKYEGYISSHDFERADDRELTALAEKIRN